MPTQEAIVNTLLPQSVEKPIPVRTISTRPPKLSNPDRSTTNRSNPAPAESAPTAESVKLSPQLSALARKEQAFRQREQALKTREKDLEAKLAEAEQYSQLKSKFGAKDFSEAEKLGLTYEEYTKYLLDKQSGEDPQTQALKKLEAEIEALKKGKEDSATQEYEETVAEYRKEIDSLITTNPDFKILKKANATEGVLQSILDAWEKDNLELSVSEAAGLAKQVLLENAKASAALLEEEQPKVEDIPKLPPPRAGSRTLTQNMAPVGVEAKPLKPLQFLSESERYAEARRRVLARREGK